ncbi:hypothetical protein HC031_28600 [Planosporangium thailandense]|uniref:Uncharacterized protein n=1 Tax=Planosporangium thailandense TaxID=765197 RepID=A0ABX0Y8Q0_9ACTN|nr:hypothetical protein [Planosporangium thailandense]NJC73654.1 hypothetical protein [Planosporangium thailandense]
MPDQTTDVRGDGRRGWLILLGVLGVGLALVCLAGVALLGPWLLAARQEQQWQRRCEAGLEG